MQNNLRQTLKQAIGFAIVGALVLLLDQITKIWVLDALAPADELGPEAPRVMVLTSFLRFQYAENRGAAFSMFQDHPEILTGVAFVLAVAVFVWAVFFLPQRERLTRLALGLIFGGAVGNLIDRFRLGFVVDFIVVHWNEHAWPTFNVADSAICVGIAIFFIASLQAAREEKNSRAEKNS